MKPFIYPNKKIKILFLVLSLQVVWFLFQCSNSTTSNNQGGNQKTDILQQNTACAGSTSSFSSSVTQPSSPTGIKFTEVGSTFPNNDLIDLEFLPHQNGDALVIGQSGAVYYMKNDFTPLSSSVTLDVEYSGEQGLLNVVADPSYASNCMVYFYHTVSGGGVNRVIRATVAVNLQNNSFSLSDQQTIIDFNKNFSSSPGDNHNGGSLFFEDDNNLFIGVGDGGGSASSDTTEAIAQNGQTRLGKILRIVPSHTAGQGGYSIPSSGNNAGSNLSEIYALGLRNPFTLFYGNGALFIGDVGLDTYEEIDRATSAGMNFGWPLEEGPGASFVNPIGGYNHGSDITNHNNEDPQDNPGGLGDGEAIMLGILYQGSQYNGFLSNRLIYSEFYQGWVRALHLDSSNNVLSDSHLGHLTGLTSLQEGPDGFLYGVSLYGSDHILRLDLE